MTNFKRGTHMTDVIFSLALFCVFAASSLMVVLIGANVYHSTVTQMNQNYDARASIIYVFTKIKQNDATDSVSIGEIDGVPALMLTREIEGTAYATRIYHYNGALHEIFALADKPVSLGDGQAIVEIAAFSMAQENENLFCFTSTDEHGREVSLKVSPRC